MSPNESPRPKSAIPAPPLFTQEVEKVSAGESKAVLGVLLAGTLGGVTPFLWQMQSSPPRKMQEEEPVGCQVQVYPWGSDCLGFLGVSLVIHAFLGMLGAFVGTSWGFSPLVNAPKLKLWAASIVLGFALPVGLNGVGSLLRLQQNYLTTQAQFQQIDQNYTRLLSDIRHQALQHPSGENIELLRHSVMNAGVEEQQDTMVTMVAVARRDRKLNSTLTAIFQMSDIALQSSSDALIITALNSILDLTSGSTYQVVYDLGLSSVDVLLGKLDPQYFSNHPAEKEAINTKFNTLREKLLDSNLQLKNENNRNLSPREKNVVIEQVERILSERLVRKTVPN